MNTPVQVGQADREPPRRHPQPDGRGVAGDIVAGLRVRAQFTHVIDIGPTVLEAAGIPEPDFVDGIAQEPMDGTSFLSRSTTRQHPSSTRGSTSRCSAAAGCTKTAGGPRRDPNASRGTSRRRRSARSVPIPTGTPTATSAGSSTTCTNDFSQAHDIAADHPDKVLELQELWWSEAERNRVLPLMGGLSVIYGILPPMPTQTRFPFAGDVQNVQRGMIPRIYGRSYSIEAEVDVPEAGAEGVLVAHADFIGGFALWVDGDGKLVHTYSFLGVEQYKQISDTPIPTGKVTLKMLFESDVHDAGIGRRSRSGLTTTRSARAAMAHTVPIAFTSYAGLDIGRDNGLVVDLDYEDQAPYEFTGTIDKVTFDLAPVTHEEALALHQHAHDHSVGSGVAG